MKKDFTFFWEKPVNKKELNLRIDVPGFRENEIRVQLTDKSISVRAAKKSEKIEKGRHFLRKESFSGTFTKSITLPDSLNLADFEISVVDGGVIIKRKKKKSGK